jgi:hypothetical protein
MGADTAEMGAPTVGATGSTNAQQKTDHHQIDPREHLLVLPKEALKDELRNFELTCDAGGDRKAWLDRINSLDEPEMRLLLAEQKGIALEPYDILNQFAGRFGRPTVNAGSTDKEVRKAYLDAAKEKHPDKHVGSEDAERERALAVFQTISNAYHTVMLDRVGKYPKTAAQEAFGASIRNLEGPTKLSCIATAAATRIHSLSKADVGDIVHIYAKGEEITIVKIENGRAETTTGVWVSLVARDGTPLWVPARLAQGVILHCH